MKTQGMRHQLLALDKAGRRKYFAYFMEQGLGKTWTALAEFEKHFTAGAFDAMVVIAPNGVHSNWIRREAPEHLSIKWIGHYWRGNDKMKTKKGKALWEKMFADHYPEGEVPARIFSFNIDTVNTPVGYQHIESVLKKYRCMMIIDESTRIKNNTAKRSIKVVELGRLAKARRILSGTPLPRSPADIYMQYHFLEAGLLGTKSFRAFNSEFTVLLEAHDPEMQAILKKIGGNGYGIPQVPRKDQFGRPMYKNLDKLIRLMEPHYFRATKAEYLPDLPEKVYKFIDFELSPKQRDVYDELKNEYNYLMEYKGEEENVKFEMIASRTKMKQVTSGFVKVYDEMVYMEDNPRFTAFKDYVEGVLEDDPERKFIVWAIFKEEMNQIKDWLESEGVVTGVYNGETSKEQREFLIDDFQKNTAANGGTQVLVCHAAAAGIGITLTAADLAIYYSCNYDNELRKQSEDRNHRIGTKSSVLYVDFIGVDTIDEEIQRSLSMKSMLADHILDGKKMN